MKSLALQKKSNKKTLIIAGVVLFTMVTAAALWYVNRSIVSQSQQKTEESDTSTIKEEQVKTGSNIQSSLPSKTGSDSTLIDQGSSPSPETPSTPPEKPNIERAGGDPTIKVVATFQKASSGNCELQLNAQDHQTLSYKSSIMVSSSYYTCSFSVSRSSLPTSNSWSAIVIHHIGTLSTKSDAKELN